MTKALVILCGGLSTRMGCDKAFLPFGTSSLLNYQIDRFRPWFDKIYVSVPAHNERPVDYAGRCGCPAIEDEFSNLGPIGGLYSCLRAVPEEILFFTSVDAPFTDPALAVALCDRLSAADIGRIHTCTIANPSGQVQPLFTAYHRSCLNQITELIQAKNYRLRDLFQEENTIVHDGFFPPEQFFNMNDPTSYYYALHKLSRETPAAFPPDLSTKATKKNIPILSFTAKSGTGKTTYLEKLLPLLRQHNLRIAVVKHDVHGFEIDRPGKDSYRLAHAGAEHMILTSEDQTAAIFTHPGLNPDLETLLGRIENVDFIITEGYKLGSQKKIHLLRRNYNETPVGSQENVIAYVTDFPFQADVPVFDLNRPEQIIPFLLEYIG